MGEMLITLEAGALALAGTALVFQLRAGLRAGDSPDPDRRIEALGREIRALERHPREACRGARRRSRRLRRAQPLSRQ